MTLISIHTVLHSQYTGCQDGDDIDDEYDGDDDDDDDDNDDDDIDCDDGDENNWFHIPPPLIVHSKWTWAQIGFPPVESQGFQTKPGSASNLVDFSPKVFARFLLWPDPSQIHTFWSIMFL